MPRPTRALPPPIVAFASWLLPGLGYVLIGQRSRGITVGVTILLLFVMGLLIGGVRVLDVPGWGASGRPINVSASEERVRLPDGSIGLQRFEHIGEDAYRDDRTPLGWVMTTRPMAEVREKPWAIAQVLTGPLGLAGMAWSVSASVDPDGPRGELRPAASPSHARVNEIGVLYTAVAGMLNLLVIIDSAHRAEQTKGVRATTLERLDRPGAGAARA